MSRFIEHGDGMADAMAAACRVLASGGGARPEADPGDASPRTPEECETLPPPSFRFIPEPEGKRKR